MMNNASSLLVGKLGEERPIVLFYEENKHICLKDEALSLSVKGVMWQPFVRIKSLQFYLFYSPFYVHLNFFA